MLEAGGNAVDATIAAALMAFVAEPVLASPGGGGFALIRIGGAAPDLFDFFGQTPLAPNRQGGDVREVVADFGPASQRFHIGPGTAVTPGVIPGLEALHAGFARLPLAALAAPAIQAARQGVVITPFQAYLNQVVEPILLANDKTRALHAPAGALASAGTLLPNPGLARFLAEIAIDPVAAYREAIVPAMLAEQARGHLRQADFDAYRVERRKPLSFRLGEARVFTNPAPAAGGILVAHALAGLAGDTPLDRARVLDLTDRARQGAGSDLSGLLATLGHPMTRGTTHISVADAVGNAVALTLTNGEGDGVLVGDYGFMLNNMLGEEDVNPAGVGDWTPNRRLSSMMAPSIALFDDGAFAALGSGGSSRIRSAITQVLAHAVLAHLPLEAAVAAPRLHPESGHLDIEAGFADADLAQLKQAFPDHRLWPGRNMFFGGCHAIAASADGVFAAAGDPRRAGIGLLV